ncbi:MAG: tetratricopeptide repeat protein [Polaribacter sp.]|nr:tetratricopeptide repeat protein [Polaribacter sp.]
MNKISKLTLFFYILINVINFSVSDEVFFKKGLELYKDNKYEDARFMFERSIVFNPKDSNSYLYLAKIYNQEEDQKKEKKNLESTLLIEPNNEEAILMSMKIALEKSNYSKVKDLSKTFSKVCKNLCDENKDVLETLSNIEPKNNES